MTVLTREFEADVRVEGKARGWADGVVALTPGGRSRNSPLPSWGAGARTST